jgi:precorrin-6Y C5,15-methyltransferase (decarboxylating)
LRIHPAPSSVSLAFARLGCSWDDAIVVSAHGRSLDEAVTLLKGAAKAAVFTAPDNPPEKIGAALAALGEGARRGAVVTRLGESDEYVFEGDLDALARGTFDPMSILIVHDDAAPTSMSTAWGTMARGTTARGTMAWGLAESQFAHRDGMITKAEVRAVALGKLQLPRRGVLWDIGAGSGSVAIEAARLAPGLRVVAIDRDADSVARIAANAGAHDVRVEAICGDAPEALATLPDPDRVFIGGGGLTVLDAALERLRPGGTVVANYALLDRAVIAWQRLGNLVELSVARGTAVGDAGVRLAAENPVFVCWGPE